MIYVPGKQLHLADTLSRAYLSDRVSGQADLEEEQIAMVRNLKVTNAVREELPTAYAADPSMGALLQAIRDGWIWNSKRIAPPLLHPYWHVRDEAHEWEGFAYLGERLVIPSSLRRKMLHTVIFTIEYVDDCQLYVIQQHRYTVITNYSPTSSEEGL